LLSTPTRCGQFITLRQQRRGLIMYGLKQLAVAAPRLALLALRLPEA
jgi:hypothetical protein